MVLQRANFEIPARFVFRPFNARWEIRPAELLDWTQQPEHGGLRPLLRPPVFVSPKRLPPDGKRVSVRIGGGLSTSAMLGGLESDSPSFTVEIARKDISSEVLAPHENPRTSRDISGRFFFVLVCRGPQFKSLYLPEVRPGDKAKNAWVMRDEFLNLDVDTGDDYERCWRLRKFLNRWGLWSYGAGFQLDSLTASPGFVLAFPHALRQKREEYRNALKGASARKWLSTAQPLSFNTIGEPPYFMVERFYCEDAIQATITIDHLAKRRFGFCKRCGKQFEQETQHKRQYCARKCIQAAGVQRWREKQRKKLRKEGKRNAKG